MAEEKKGIVKRLMSHPVWTLAVAPGLGALALYLTGGWTPTIAWCAKTAMRLWTWLNSTVPVPWWGVLLGGVVVLFAVLVITMRIIAAVAQKQRKPLKMAFVGLVWRWRYDSIGDIVGVASFCEMCDYQIYARHPFAMGSFNPGPALYHCDSCGHRFQSEVSHDEMVSRVEREIQLRARKAIGQGV